MNAEKKLNETDVLVSVIVPNFNHAPYLERRIDSVLKQTYLDFEVIILDDHSTDNSVQIIQKYVNHPKISHIVLNQVNSGSPFVQWKKGIELAKGEYIWIAESDDYADTTFLEQVVPLLDKDEKVVLAYCDSIVIDSSGTRKFKFADNKIEWLKSKRWLEAYCTSGQKEVDDYLAYDCTINNTSAVVFRKDPFINSNPFDQQYRYIGDWYVFLKVLKNGSISYIPDGLNYYRNHENHCIKTEENAYKFLDEYFRLYDFLDKNYIIKNRDRFKASFDLYTRHYGMTSNKELLKIYKKLYSINSSLFLRMLVKNLLLNMKDKIKMIKK